VVLIQQKRALVWKLFAACVDINSNIYKWPGINYYIQTDF